MVKPKPIQPAGWKPPRGYSNGMLVSGAARLVFVAGQVAWDAEQELVGGSSFALQFEQALKNVVAVVEAGGGKPEHIVQMTIFVIDRQQYSTSTKAIGACWRELFGKHYPAMALVEVAALLEDRALVEIQAVAALP